MRAMILAAGVGARLGPLTRESPKALVEIEGVPLLEIVIRRLLRFGVKEIIVNAFHRAEQVEAFLEPKGRFGARIELSRETELLDTGGGLKKAEWFFDDGRPFLVHNVDVLTDLDLRRMARFHEENGALATLAVRGRESARCLLFDPGGRLRGRETGGRPEWAGAPCREFEALAFSGIHVVSPAIFPKISESGAFPITKAYLRLAAAGENILAFREDGGYWLDVGSPERLEEARVAAAQGIIQV